MGKRLSIETYTDQGEPRLTIIRGPVGSGKTSKMLSMTNDRGQRRILGSLDNYASAQTFINCLKAEVDKGKRLFCVDDCSKGWVEEIKRVMDEGGFGALDFHLVVVQRV